MLDSGGDDVLSPLAHALRGAALNAGTVGIMVPVSVLFTIVVSRLLYKRGVL